jgi:hypothetical protein
LLDRVEQCEQFAQCEAVELAYTSAGAPLT